MSAQSSVIAKMRSLEEELKILRFQLVEEKVKRHKSFSDLKGVWRGKVDLNLEEIQSVELKLEGE